MGLIYGEVDGLLIVMENVYFYVYDDIGSIDLGSFGFWLWFDYMLVNLGEVFIVNVFDLFFSIDGNVNFGSMDVICMLFIEIFVGIGGLGCFEVGYVF